LPHKIGRVGFVIFGLVLLGIVGGWFGMQLAPLLVQALEKNE
jgi:hypothetical protein